MFQNEKLWEAYEPPFSCDHDSAMVMDKNGIAIIVVRGWGRLSQMFEHDEAFKLQLDIAHFVANKLNELATGKLMGQHKNCIHCGGSGYVHMDEGEYSECPCIVVDNQEIIRHLKWIYDRMVHRLDQDPRIDYMIKFKSIIDSL